MAEINHIHPTHRRFLPPETVRTYQMAGLQVMPVIPVMLKIKQER